MTSPLGRALLELHLELLRRFHDSFTYERVEEVACFGLIGEEGEEEAGAQKRGREGA